MPRPIDQYDCIRHAGQYYPHETVSVPPAPAATAPAATAETVPATASAAAAKAPSVDEVNCTEHKVEATATAVQTPAPAAPLNKLQEGYNYKNGPCLGPR